LCRDYKVARTGILPKIINCKYFRLLKNIFRGLQCRANWVNIEQKTLSEKRIKEIEKIITDLDEQLYLTKEITREKYQTFATKFDIEKAKLLENLENNSISSSNLSQKIIEVGELALKLPEMWQKSNYADKVNLQKLIFPEGMTFDKKTGVLLTLKTNEAIIQTARVSGDLAINEKGLDVKNNVKSLTAEK